MRNLVLLLALSALLAGCQSQPKQPEKKVTYPDTSPPRQPFPHIVSVTPDTVSASRGSASVGRLRVSYTIPTPEKVEKAELQLYNPVTRVIARTPVPIQAQGDIDWTVGATADIGPSVRLRADCPTGYTDWVVFGLYQYPASSAQTYINNVTPQYIRDMNTMNPDVDMTRTITPIEVWGAGFQRDCKLQASVNNGPPQELNTMFAGPRHLMAQLPWVGEVGSRYIEVKLILRGQGFATEDIFRINVNDE